MQAGSSCPLWDYDDGDGCEAHWDRHYSLIFYYIAGANVMYSSLYPSETQKKVLVGLINAALLHHQPEDILSFSLET